MAFYHKWDVKNDFVYVLQFFQLIYDGLGGVYLLKGIRVMVRAKDWPVKRITKANVNYYNRIYLFLQIEITLQQKFAVHVHTYKNISLSKADKNSKRKEIVKKVSMWIFI